MFFEIIVIVIALSKWPIWLSTYRIEVADLEKGYRIFVIEVVVKLVPTTAKSILDFVIHETGSVREADIYVTDDYYGFQTLWDPVFLR